MVNLCARMSSNNICKIFLIFCKIYFTFVTLVQINDNFMKRMNFLLPHRCQTAGWCLTALPFVLYGLYLVVSAIFPDSAICHAANFHSRILSMSFYLCMAIGGFLLCFSCEKQEDEMIMSLRLRSVAIAAAVGLVVTVVFHVYWGVDSVVRFDYSPESFWYSSYSILFPLLFPLYFVIFKLSIVFNGLHNEE